MLFAYLFKGGGIHFTPYVIMDVWTLKIHILLAELIIHEHCKNLMNGLQAKRPVLAIWKRVQYEKVILPSFPGSALRTKSH